MLGCKHYQRGCKFVSPCCGDIFWCRHCHNEEKYDETSICSDPATCEIKITYDNESYNISCNDDIVKNVFTSN